MNRLRGTVVSGRGDFSYWMEKLADHYERKTGVSLYPGTLNLALDAPWRVPPNPIRLEAREYGGRVSVSIVPCEILGMQAFILRTDQNEAGTGAHPLNIIEIAAQVRLRDAFSLADGDIVEVQVA